MAYLINSLCVTCSASRRIHPRKRARLPWVLIGIVLLFIVPASYPQNKQLKTIIIPNKGEITAHEVLVEWSISSVLGIGDVSNVSSAVDISKRVGASAVLLVLDVSEISNLSRITSYVGEYRNAGLEAYISVAAKRLLTPTDVAPLLSLDIKGVAENLFGTFDEASAESSLISLGKACSNKNKLFAYYQGDGLGNLNATMLSSQGITVWAWWTGGWKPATWSISPIWAQECVYTQGGLYSTPSEIQNWYSSLPSKPYGIVWWLTTCAHSPTEEQQTAMGQVSQAFT